MFRKLLVPVDYNEPARRPLRLAQELARAGNGKAVLLFVIDDRFPNPDLMSFQLPWADYYRHLRDEAAGRLETLREELGGGEEIEIEVTTGAPAPTIARFATEEGFDLIVMATHGVTGIGKTLLGSVTRKVLHLAEVPVLVVRLHDEEDSAPGRAQ